MAKGFQFGFGFSKALAAPAAIDTPLRVIGVSERGANGRLTLAANRNSGVTYAPIHIGQDSHDIVLSFWCYNVTGSEGPNGNGITVTELALISPDGIAVQGFFGAAAGIAIADNTSDIQANRIPAYAFGRSKMAAGETWFAKIMFTFPANGNIPIGANRISDGGVGQSWFYDSAATTVSTALAAGPFTFTGATPQGQNFWWKPFALGHPVIDGPSYITHGDSIGEGTGDNETAGPVGRGFVARAVYNGGVDMRPCMNFCRASSRSTLAAGSHFRKYIKYARIAIDQYLTNDANDGGVTTLANLQSRFTTLNNIYRNNGIEKIIKTELMYYTDSTDLWTTYPNQTNKLYWEPGGPVNLFNNWLATQIGVTIDRLASMAAMRDPGGSYKALTDGVTPRLVANDTVHPSPNGHAVAKVPLRAAMMDLEASL